MWMRGVSAIELSPQPWSADLAGGKLTDGLHPSRGARWAHVLGVNSVVTSPSVKAGLRRGRGTIEGLAWTGAAAVVAVDVTVDGGRTWQPATLTRPANRGALQRFSLTLDWDGRPLRVASRATDSGGATQPDPLSPILTAAWAAGRHVNAIQSWNIGQNGRVLL